MSDGVDEADATRAALGAAGATRYDVPNGLAAVLWDMDGTLVDSEKLWDVSLHDLARHLGGELSDAARAAMVGSSMGRTLEIMFDEVGRRPEPTALADAARWLSRRTEELFLAQLSWRPGAHAAVRMVRGTGLATALVTSTERSLVERALDSIGREHFDVTVCGDEVPATKPAPDPYLIAADKLGMDPRCCLAVEDSPLGAAAAEAAGCAVLVVPSEVPVPPGPARIHRDGLVGLTEAELHEVWARGQSGDHWSSQTAHSSGLICEQ
jgi:HAD superfamily hydrolase (TIGR01509 family)